jgi:hypothetical protein
MVAGEVRYPIRFHFVRRRFGFQLSRFISSI